MALITRQYGPNPKGSKLTIEEMDDNLLWVNNLTEVTYSELVGLIDDSELVPGQHYKITDYRTCYDQPLHDVNGGFSGANYKQADVDPIIVLATSANTLAADAYQPSYPNDKIKYDWTWNETEITSSSALGRITERIDEWNNRTDYDHRVILFKRWRTYYYNTSNPEDGLVTINGGTTVTGNGTFFTNLTEGDYINIKGKNYKITLISNDTSMEVEGVIYENWTDVLFYTSSPEIDASQSTIPYTHTQMTDPPVDNQNEAAIGDFIMDGAVELADNYFGASSEYFTNLYPGMFTLVAKDINIEYFAINGNLGADGDGSVDIYTYNTNVGGNDYTAYVKRVYGASDPSINHIFIVNTDGTGITQDYDSGSDTDYHQISNLGSVTELHYLLLSRFNPDDKIEDATIDTIVGTYLSLVNGLNINSTLSTLNSQYSTITSIVPDLFLFNDVQDSGENPGNIDDGGEDMYDGSNFIFTDRTINWRAYEWKQSNIIDDITKELTTFRTTEELQNNGNVTSVSNYIGDYATYYLNTNLSIGNSILPNITFGFYSYGNNLGDRCYNIGTYNWFNRNQISGTFQRNTLRRGFYANVIGEYFKDNESFAQCWRNKIGEYFENNFLGNNDFQNNIVNNGANDNVLCMYGDVYKNVIGNGFNENKIWTTFRGNHVGNAFNENIIYSSFNDNQISEYFESNTIGEITQIGNASFYYNIVGNYFRVNTALGDVYYNHIGTNFEANNTLGGFRDNQIGNNFSNNNTGEEFAFNVIGSAFQGNTIGDSFGYGLYVPRGNKIGNSFVNNTIGNNFYDNVIGNNLQSNTIVDNFKYNQILYPIGFTNFTLSTHVYAEYNCTILRGSDGNYYLQYFDGTVTQTVAIDA